MKQIRALIRNYRNLAIVLLALALCIKALVPAGYMIGGSAKILTIEICNDGLGKRFTKQISIPIDSSHGAQKQHGQTDGRCAYSALAMAGLAGADAPLLALALAFILALGFAAQSPAPVARASHLRPPLRGPPAAA